MLTAGISEKIIMMLARQCGKFSGDEAVLYPLHIDGLDTSPQVWKGILRDNVVIRREMFRGKLSVCRSFDAIGAHGQDDAWHRDTCFFTHVEIR
jgi:hypothetical protein